MTRLVTLCLCTTLWAGLGGLYAESGQAIQHQHLSSLLNQQPSITDEEQATIERALEDMRSDNPEYRAGAVMLLGKYPVDQARQAVVNALADPQTRVRRAALVSVVEWNRNAPAEAVLPVLNLIGDADVELRRTASAAIPSMMAVRRSHELLLPGRSLELPGELRAMLLAAYLDSDVIVRRNMLANHYMLNLPVPGEVFLKLTEDEDRQVRLGAIPLAARFSDREAFTRRAQAMLSDADRTTRLRLVKELSQWPSQSQQQLLRQLSDDPDDEIAAEALLGRFRQAGTRDLFTQLVQRLQNKQMKQEQGVRFIQLMRLRRDDAGVYIGTIIDLDDPVLRREAARLFFDLGFAPRHPDILKGFIEDESPEVRAVAVDYLETRYRELKPEIYDEMLASPHSDVRFALMQILRGLDSHTAEPYLYDLLLDENIDIRQVTLREMAARQIDGWQDVVAASLDDPDARIQRHAVDLIMRTRMPNGPALLESFSEHNPDSPLVPLIEFYLQSRNRTNTNEML
ncbi:MAG: HEAT repeat domain-containing protein [Verrucomicrobiota bacterium]